MTRWWRIVAGLGLLAVAAVMVAWPLSWQHRSATAGRHEIEEVRHAIAAHQAQAQAPCTAPAWPQILEIPKIGLTAPVEDGTSDAVLDVAVGHDPATAPPGPAATSVLVAHDVSWFARLDELRPGDRIDVTDECGVTQRFAVTATRIARPGDPVGPGLVLSTCWPLDALWWTARRFVVTAAWVGATQAVPPVLPSPSVVSVPAPPSLVAAGDTMASWPLAVGTFAALGTPPSPEDDWRLLAAGERLWIGLERAFLEDRPDWWAALAPGVPPMALRPGGPLDVTADWPEVTLSDGATTVTATVEGTELVATGVRAG
jgi:sortase A